MSRCSSVGRHCQLWLHLARCIFSISYFLSTLFFFSLQTWQAELKPDSVARCCMWRMGKPLTDCYCQKELNLWKFFIDEIYFYWCSISSAVFSLNIFRFQEVSHANLTVKFQYHIIEPQKESWYKTLTNLAFFYGVMHQICFSRKELISEVFNHLRIWMINQ